MSYSFASGWRHKPVINYGARICTAAGTEWTDPRASHGLDRKKFLRKVDGGRPRSPGELKYQPKQRSRFALGELLLLQESD